MSESRICRLVQLLQLLQDERGTSLATILKETGVTKRTIFRDLKILKRAGIELEFRRNPHRYYMSLGDFRAADRLTFDESLAVWVAANSLGRDSLTPLYDLLQSAAEKAIASLPSNGCRRIKKLSKHIEFQPRKQLPPHGKDSTFQTILEAVDKRFVLHLFYSSASRIKPFDTDLRPYRLVFGEHAWYVVGHSSVHQGVRIFNFANIEAVELSRSRYVIPKQFDWQRSVRNAWSIYPEQFDSHVVIKFSAVVAQSVAQVKWHKTQKTQLNADGTLIFQVTVSGLSEISSWIMRYGEYAEVMYPQKLRRLIARRIAKMAEKYAIVIDQL